MKTKPVTPPTEPAKKPFSLQKLIVNSSPLIFGAAVAFAFAQWQSQQHQLALLTQMVEQMQPSDPDVVSRNSPLDLQGVGTSNDTMPDTVLSSIAAIPAPVQVPAPQPQTAFVAPAVTAPAPAPAAPTPAAYAEPEVAAPAALAKPATTADKLRALTLSAQAPQVDDEMMKRARRMETLAIIDAGVQELVAAVVAGEYDIHTNYEDADFSGRIHFAFVGHEEDQSELERFLAKAAEDGVIAHSSSVVTSDGSVNGHILLFDLVERALENGTKQEQAAGEKMRREAVALLAADVDVGEPENAAGDRYYVVEPGDSLAYIALQFYGNTNDYTKIFEANRNLIRNPEKINVGQRLLIPSA